MAAKVPWGLKWRSSKSFIIGTVGLGLFTDLFLYGLVVPILPFILEERVGLPPAAIQRNTSNLLAVYAAASTIFSPPAGIIADRLPARRLPFLVGLTALMGATALFGVGTTLPVLTVARVLQGMSAAVVWTVGLAMLFDAVGPENLGRTVGSIFGFISIGELLAPVSGGALYAKAGQPGVFGLAFALLILDFIMRLLVIEKKSAALYGRETEDDPQSSPSSARSETLPSGEEEPLLPKDKIGDAYRIHAVRSGRFKHFPIAYVLTDVRLLISFWICFLHSTLLASFDATIPVQVKETFGFGSLNAGIVFVPLLLPGLVLGPLFGWMVDRVGSKPVATVGFGYLLPVLALLRLPSGNENSQVVLFCIILGLAGMGLCSISSISIVESSSLVRQYHESNPGLFGENGPYAQLYALNSMTFSLGATVGPLVAGSLRESIGFGNENLVLGVLCLLTSILTFLYTGGPPRILKPRSKLESDGAGQGAVPTVP